MQEPKLSRLTYTVIALLASMVLAIAYALIFGEPVPVVVTMPEESVVVNPQISVEQPAAGDPSLAYDTDTTHFTNLSTTDLTVSDDLTVTDDSTLTDDTSIGGDLTVTGAGTVGGNLTVSDAVTVTQSGKDLAVGDDLTVAGDVTVSDAVTVTQSGKDLEVGDDLTVYDDTVLTDDVDVGGDLNFGGSNLYPLGYTNTNYQIVAGTASITGTLAVSHGLTEIITAICTLGEDPTSGGGDGAMCTATISGSTVTLKVWQDDFVTEATETGVDVHYAILGQ
jgi:hypothetical protein